MNSFFEQLAAQSDLKVVGQVPLESAEQLVGLEGQGDIVESDVSEDHIPPPEDVSLETREIPPSVEPVFQEIPPSLVEIAIPEEQVETVVAEEMPPVDPVDLGPVEGPPVEAQEVSEMPETDTEPASEPSVSEPEVPSAPGLEEVFAWIAAGENLQPEERDSPVPSRLSTIKTVNEVISDIVQQEADPPIEPAQEEPAPPVFSIPAQLSKEPDPLPSISGAPQIPKHGEPSVPSISIGAIQVTVDAGAAPEPVRPRVVEASPVPPPRRSSRTQLRRHYIIPH